MASSLSPLPADFHSPHRQARNARALASHALLVALVSISATLFAAETRHVNGMRDKTPTLVAFTGARIVISPSQTLDRATLVIEHGKIVAVGRSVRIPSGATVVDLSGKTIYAGFIDPFTEYGVKKSERQRRGFGERAPQYDPKRGGASAWNDAIRADARWLDSFEPDPSQVKELAGQGVTAVYSVGRDGVFRGRGGIALVDSGLVNDVTIRSDAAHALAFDKGSSTQEYPSSLMGSIALVRQTMLDAGWYQRAQAAYRANPAQGAPEENSALDALAGISVERAIFETADVGELLRATRIAKEFGVDWVYVGGGDEWERVREVKAAGVTVITPVNYPAAPNVKNVGDEADASLRTLRFWERAPYNAAALERDSVPFAFTTLGLKSKDAFLKNLRLAVKRGLSRTGALAALTTTPARILAAEKLLGTLSVGKYANFIVTNGDVFDDSTTLYQVWVAGKRREVNAFPPPDIRGKYTLTLPDAGWTLKVKGKAEKPSAEVLLGEMKRDVKSLSIAEDKLDFALTIDTLEWKGQMRFSGRAQGDTLSGVVTLADGNSASWRAVKTAAYTPEADSADTTAKKGAGDTKGEKKKDQPDNAADTLISHVTYPNVAFGWSALPKMEDALVRNATLWTCEAGGVIEGADLLIQRGKISQIGKNLRAPAGVRVIDATGKHVTPGVIDEHSHIAIAKGVNEGSEAVSAEVRIGDVIDPDDIDIYRQLAGGVTCSELLHGSANPIGGQAQVIKLRWGASSEKLKLSGCPRTIKFALGENVKQSNWGDNNTVRYPQTRMGVETIMKDHFQAAREYERAWVAAGGSNRISPRRDLRLEALADILNKKLFIHCHSYVATEILMLMRLAEEFNFKVQTFTHILEGYKVADEMARHGASASNFSDWWDYKFEVYDAIAYNSALMSERGVVTAVNSDSPDMARRLNQEAAKGVKYGGMTREEAIKMCTLNPAKTLKIDHQVGSLKVGKDADFVIWSADPLSVYAKVEQTWIDGKLYFSMEQDRILRAEVRGEKAALIQKALKAESEGGDSGSGGRKGRPSQERDWDCDDVVDVWEDGK